MKVHNPYANVNFSAFKMVRSVTHEHIYTEEQAKICFHRGIRVFCNVNYQPAVPSLKMSGWSRTFKDWSDVYTKDELLAAGVINHDGKPDFSKTEYFTDVTFSGSIPTITMSSGEVVDTNLVPQIANAEHTDKKDYWGGTGCEHHTVLGSTWSDVGVRSYIGNTGKQDMSFRRSFPLYSIKEETELLLANQQFPGKLFGQICHSTDYLNAERLAKIPQIYKSVELFNQSASPARQKKYRETYDKLLRNGYNLMVTAVVDWQQSIESYNDLLPYEKEAFADVNDYNRQCEKGTYKKESNYIRGCNVLLLNTSYGSDLASDTSDADRKAEMAMDAYLAGRYFASGFGNHCIKDLSVSGDIIHFQVQNNSNPAGLVKVNVNETQTNTWVTSYDFEDVPQNLGDLEKLFVITNLGKKEYSSPEVNFKIEKGVSYVRFEAYFADKDFIFTNPVWIEENAVSGDLKKRIVLI